MCPISEVCVKSWKTTSNLCHPEYRGSMVLWNVGILLHHYTVLKPEDHDLVLFSWIKHNCIVLRRGKRGQMALKANQKQFYSSFAQINDNTYILHFEIHLYVIHNWEQCYWIWMQQKNYSWLRCGTCLSG